LKETTEDEEVPEIPTSQKHTNDEDDDDDDDEEAAEINLNDLSIKDDNGELKDEVLTRGNFAKLYRQL
jgi:hypothetical protein